VEDTLAVASIEDLSSGAIRTFLNLEPGGEPGVETLEEAQLTVFFGEFSVTAKAFKTQGCPMNVSGSSPGFSAGTRC
jgi:hypothetical protein